MPPTPEELQRRIDYKTMQEQLQGAPVLSGYASHDAAHLTTYVLALRDAYKRPFTEGEVTALTNHVSYAFNTSSDATLRRTLRQRATQHRLQIQATYEAAFRAGYKARKILQDSSSQKAYHKGYEERGKEEALREGKTRAWYTARNSQGVIWIEDNDLDTVREHCAEAPQRELPLTITKTTITKTTVYEYAEREVLS